MATQEVNRTPAQDGSFIAAGWEESLGGLSLAVGGPAPSVVGLVFDWSLSTNSAGTVLDPPIISSLSLTLVGHADMSSDPGTDTIEVWYVPEVDPDDYGTTLAPFTRSEVFLASANFTWAGVGTSVTIDLTQTAELWDALRMLYLGSSRWSGRLALSIANSGFGGPFTFNSNEGAGGPTLTSVETPFWNGLTGAGSKGERMVRDGRFGMPATNRELVRDGDNKGLWVRPTDGDPEDEQQTYRPKPGEGTVDDTVPNL